MNKVSISSRYMATRLAMIRQACDDGQADIRKVDTNDNPAGIFIKPLVGDKFLDMHARAMGLSLHKSKKTDAFTTSMRSASQMAREGQRGSEFSSGITGDGPGDANGSSHQDDYPLQPPSEDGSSNSAFTLTDHQESTPTTTPQRPPAAGQRQRRATTKHQRRWRRRGCR